jgi:pilus assembly protein CpaE
VTEVQQQILRAIIISPDTELASYVHRILADTERVSVARVVNDYPNQIDLTRILRSHGPQVVFVSIDRPDHLATITAHIEQTMPGMQVVAFGRSVEPQVLMEIMRAGIREFLAAPFERTCVWDCLTRVSENLTRRPVSLQASDLVYSFLPAKPGVGATTLAINASLAVARQPDTKALLMDFDLNCGMIRFMLKMTGSYSVLDAAEHSATMDENLWPQIATKCEDLDVVHAGVLNPEIRIQNMQIQHLLDFARRNYKVVCADLSGNLEKYSMEIMRDSRRIFLVCTPELSSLHLAREKLQYLQRMDLGDRVRVLLNRYAKRTSISPAEVEQVVGAPVMMTFANDYAKVARAIQEGGAIEQTCELGRGCAELAGHMLDKKLAAATEPKRKFVEYFNISPAKFSLERSKG